MELRLGAKTRARGQRLGAETRSRDLNLRLGVGAKTWSRDFEPRLGSATFEKGQLWKPAKD